ncbi:MAG TPA: pyrroline-5-carboxylate reductase [Beijerinckiaceae bacterium]|jgi:pyrroline-5-carboxylate reductase
MTSFVSALPSSLVLVGAGKMGGAMLEGWLAVGLDPAGIAVIDPKPSPEIEALSRGRGIRLNPSNEVRPPEVAVLAIKPQTLDAAAAEIGRIVGPGTLLVSILAGKTIADLRARISGVRAVVRAMPNLPASVGKGATGAAASPETSEAQKAAAHALLSAVGVVEWLDTEDLIDAVTALSGSGPAYVFHLVECLTDAGAAVGLPPDLAGRLARAMVIGSGELLAQSDLPASRLRENVTSPGGTTAAALEVLMRAPGLSGLMREAVAAAKRRAEELSG